MPGKGGLEPKKKRRRANGEGTIIERADGRFMAQFYPENGKRRTVYGKTRTECAVKLREAQAKDGRGELVPTDRITVEQWSREWLEDIKKINYRAKSYGHRSSVINNWIIPLLGSIQLQKLQPRQIQKLFVGKMTHLAPNTISGYYGVLHTLLEDAALRGIIAKNPCEHIALPEIKTVERPVLTMEQVDLFLAELEGDWLAPMAELAIYTAMREGEICSLRWQDIDFEEKSLLVRSTVSWIPRQGFVVGPPKTDSSERRIALPQIAASLLLDHRTRQKVQKLASGTTGWNPLGLVFPHENGGYRADRVIDKRVKKVVTKLGLSKKFTFHCLRHTAVALLIKAGAHPKMIQEICGHSSIEMTMNLYGHLFEGMHREAMDRLDAVFSSERAKKRSK